MSLMETILTANALITSVLSIVPNLMIIFLACTTKVAEIRQYRWIIASQSALEIAISTALAILNMTLYDDYNSMLMFICGNGVRHSIPFSVAIFSIYCIMLMLSIFTHPIAFLYRYAYICGKDRIKTLFTLRGTISTSIFFTALSVVFVFALWQRTTIAVYDAIEFSQIEGTIVVISITYENYRSPHGMAIDLICTMLFLLVVVAAYVTVFYCTEKIFKKLGTSDMHAKTKSVQRQLNFVMLLQATFPIFFTTLPIIMFFVCIGSDLQIGEVASVIIILLNWQPCAHPFISMYFVAPFRKRILRAVSCKSTNIRGRLFSITHHTSHHVPIVVVSAVNAKVTPSPSKHGLCNA
ncbi:hypothetical protein Tcan_04456 [Toxocara canis]|uniref:G protein-coupled receptor n=1 Tax=Toxocara canis TaxID=6265 RepID=A0A0B2VCY6_TOXCA|nr:hypothetical protein Tcan_04456 [Toxocara canis]